MPNSWSPQEEPKSKKHENEKEKEGVEDPWALPELVSTEPKWAELNNKGKVLRVLETVGKLLVLLILLYFFICSISLLASAFRLLGGKKAGKIFQNNEILENPIAGLMIGILATVLVQSSSTSTSIVVTMVSAGILQVHQAIYIVMGANIGTSVTNTIVSVFHSGDRAEFRRAFAGATVHDMFNWLCVIVLLPIEWIISAATGKGYLVWLSEAIVDSIPSFTKGTKQKFLKVLTDPFTKKIVQLDKSVIKALAKQNTSDPNSIVTGTIAKHYCKNKAKNITEKCSYLFNVGEPLSDATMGVILLILSLATLCICLILIVKVLRTMLGGSIALTLRRVVNVDYPGIKGHAIGYLSIIVGAVLTFLVQSSSIFTSTLTPLVAVGVLTLDRVYPLTLGANIGTTGTALIAAFASDSIKRSLQIALCHLFFNISGILIWYPIPLLREVPINLAKALGNTTAEYRWFAVFYLLIMFLVIPLLVFGLSLVHYILLAVVGAIVIGIAIFITTINCLKKRKPSLVPGPLKSWKFLPEPLRSLKPIDRLVTKLIKSVTKLCRRKKVNEPSSISVVSSGKVDSWGQKNESRV